jgi:hypothetical protein
VANIRFDMDDAWLFWSIPASEEGTDLRGMIGAADAINHAIPSREQIARTINRGLRAGIIEAAGGRFRYAPGFREDIAAANGVSTTWFKQWDAIFSYLSSREWKRIAKGTYRLTEKRYRNVVEEYIRTF